MATINIKLFGGMAPRVSPRLLQDQLAQNATDVNLESGNLKGFKTDSVTNPKSGTTTLASSSKQTIFKYTDSPERWLQFDEDVDVHRGPIPGDSNDTIYWTGQTFPKMARSSDAIAGSAVVAGKIASGAVTTAKIAADAVTNAKIADDAIDSEHYTDGSIDTAHLGDLQVTTAKIAADAITGAKIADDAIDSEHYTDGSIDTAHIADAQITSAKIANATLVLPNKLDMNGNELILDADADTSITSDTDDQIDIHIAGADDFRFTANNMNVLSGSTLTIDSGATITNSGTASGFGITWNIGSAYNSNFNASAGNGYFVSTSGGAVTATLPASPSAGDEVRFIDLSATFDTNNLTVGRNSEKIMGDAADLTVATERAGFGLVYSDSTNGWLLIDK